VVSYSMGKTNRTEIIAKSASELPGPGNYESPTKRGGPTYTIGTKGKSQKASDVPGPGHYNEKDSLSKSKSVAYGWSKEKRGDFTSKTAKDMPGPGNYESPVKIGKGGPQYTVMGKAKEKRLDFSPGPGHYTEQAESITKNRTISYKMS